MAKFNPLEEISPENPIQNRSDLWTFNYYQSLVKLYGEDGARETWTQTPEDIARIRAEMEEVNAAAEEVRKEWELDETPTITV